MKTIKKTSYKFLPTKFNVAVHKFLRSDISNIKKANLNQYFDDIVLPYMAMTYAKYKISFIDEVLASADCSGIVVKKGNECYITLCDNRDIKNDKFRKYNILSALFHECVHIEQDRYIMKPYQTQPNDYYSFMCMEYNAEIPLAYDFKLNEIDARFKSCQVLNSLIENNVIKKDIEMASLLAYENLTIMASLMGISLQNVFDDKYVMESNTHLFLKNKYCSYVSSLKMQDHEKYAQFTLERINNVMNTLDEMGAETIKNINENFKFICKQLESSPETLAKVFPIANPKGRIKKLNTYLNTKQLNLKFEFIYNMIEKIQQNKINSYNLETEKE